MMRKTITILTIFACVFFMAGCQDDGNFDVHQSVLVSDLQQGDTDSKSKSEPDPSGDSYLPAGPDGAGGTILPNGRRITPASNMEAGHVLAVGSVPVDCISEPAGDYVYMVSLRDDSVYAVNTQTWAVEDVEPIKVFVGMAINAAGTKLWVSGGAKLVVHEFDVAGGELVLNRDIRISGFTVGLALSPDEQTLYAASSYGHRLAIIDLASGLEVRSGICQVYPYGVALNADGSRAYVSNWGSRSVSVINTATGKNLANIAVGKNPEQLVVSPDGSKVYVANSDSDTISVIDTATLTEADTIPVIDEPETKGASPTHMMLDNGRLYVVCSGYNSIAVIDIATDKVLGHIPTAWYPTSVCKNPVREEMYVTCGKGEGWVPEKAVYIPGTANKFDADFTDGELADYTARVIENNLRPATFYEDLDFESPIPTQVGVPSEQIKHVVFVLKENKTYDAIFGDMPTGNGDPSLNVFGIGYTPNAHALATRFTNCDNLYSEAELSLAGHLWSTATVCNDYVEKSWPIEGREALSGVEPAAIPEREFIFQHMLNHGVAFRSYGQVVGTLSDMDRLAPYVSLKYGFWNMGVSDEVKVDEIIRDIEAGIFPPLVYISLPNDHTEGNDAGKPTVPWYVGDNDAALGKLVDYLSHSPYWKETAIFVTQDDPQSTADHVDAHRTVGLVISPWAKSGYISSVLYSMNSMWVTMELILGVPPLSNYDQYSAPMYDCFTTTPDLTPYDKIDNPIPFEVNPKGLPFQEYCANEDWDAPDQIERLGEVVWSVMRPGEPFPHQYSVDPLFVEDPEEEAEEARQYRAMVKAWTQYGRVRGIEPLKTNLY